MWVRMRLNPFQPFIPYLRPYRRTVIAGILLLLLIQAITTSLPMALKVVIDTAHAAFENKPTSTYTGTVRGDIALVAGIMACLAFVRWLLSIAMRYLLSGASRYVERDLRAAYVRHLLALPMRFFEERRVGDLMARATNDVEAIQRFLHHAFRMTLTALLVLVLSLTLMCVIDWQLAFISLLPMPIMAIVINVVAVRIRRGYRMVQEQFADMTALIQENLSGMRVNKGFAREAREVDRFSELNGDYVQRNRRLINIGSFFFPFAFLMNGLSLILVLWLGGLRVIEGSLSLGSFVAFNAYLIQMGAPMRLLGRLVDEFQRAAASLGRIEAILGEPTETRREDDTLQLRGDIEFRGTRYSYVDDHAVLDDISIKVQAGGTLGIVGRVGSGKSTLARLLPQLIRSGPEQLLVDGMPIEGIPVRTLRDSIGYVPQDSFLFSQTLRENIAIGGNGVSNDDVELAAEIAHLTPDIQDFPEGLDTIVGERGVTLSGGQKQRAAIARAVVGKPPILILDDALASVDTHTEDEILRRLEQVVDSCTTVIISHRVSTVRRADRIIVLDDGRIAEQGSHDELVAQNGIYAELCRRQDLAQELDEL